MPNLKQTVREEFKEKFVVGFDAIQKEELKVGDKVIVYTEEDGMVKSPPTKYKVLALTKSYALVGTWLSQRWVLRNGKYVRIEKLTN